MTTDDIEKRMQLLREVSGATRMEGTVGRYYGEPGLEIAAAVYQCVLELRKIADELERRNADTRKLIDLSERGAVDGC